MSAVIETEGLTKFYGRSRGIWFVDLTLLVGRYFLNALGKLVK